ncbi:MAG: hypothetical protein IJR89_09425 [Clostridia bacterium]|nr:hypothetical protein [Clostridia bacterium]
MKRLLSLLICVFVLLSSCLLFSFAAAAEEAVVYVKDGGTGDGSSASSPLGTLDAALQAIASTGGTVKVVEAVTLAGNTAATAEVDTYYAEPAHTRRITITSADPANKAKLIFPAACQWYALSGPTVFEEIGLVDNAETFVRILGRGHHVTMGEGLEMYFGETLQTPSDVSAGSMKGFTVIGITNVGAEYDGYLASDTKITVKSGVYYLIQAYTRNFTAAGDLTGNAYVEILGDIAVRQIGLASLKKGHTCSGQAYLYWAAQVIAYWVFPGYDSAAEPFTANFFLADGADFRKDTDPTATQKLVGAGKVKTLNIWHDTSASATALADHFKSTYSITQADGSVNQAALADYNGPAYRIPADPAPLENTGTGTDTGTGTSTGTGTDTGTGTETGTGTGTGTAPNTGDGFLCAAAAAVLALAGALVFRKKARG